MMICNDRRWPEAWRVLGLQQVELVMLGYNTPSLNMENRGFEAHHLRVFHCHLSIQAGCYQNACFARGVGEGGDGGRARAVRPFHHREPAGRDHGPGDVLGRRADRRRVRPRHVRAGPQHDLQLRPRIAGRRHYGRITAQVGSEPPAVWSGARAAE